MGICFEKEKDEQKNLIDHPVDILEKLRNQITLKLINYPTQKDFARLKLIERLLVMYNTDEEH